MSTCDAPRPAPSALETAMLLAATVVVFAAAAMSPLGLFPERAPEWGLSLLQPAVLFALALLVLSVSALRGLPRGHALAWVPALAVAAACAAAVLIRSGGPDGDVVPNVFLFPPAAGAGPALRASDGNAAMVGGLALAAAAAAAPAVWRAAGWVADGLCCLVLELVMAVATSHLIGVQPHLGPQALSRSSPGIAGAVGFLAVALAAVRGRRFGGVFAAAAHGTEVGRLARRVAVLVLAAPPVLTVAAVHVVRWRGDPLVLAVPLVVVASSVALALPCLALLRRLAAARAEADAAWRAAEGGARSSEEARSRLDLALEAGRIGTWVTDLRTGAVRRSDMLYRIYGLERREPELPVDTWRAIVHPEDRARIWPGRDRLGRDSPLYQSTHRVVRANDGAVRVVRVSARWFADPDDPARGPGHIVGMTVDLTEETEARREAELASTEKSRMIASAGHDLGQPLQILALQIDRLGDAARANAPDLAATAAAVAARDADAVAALSRIAESLRETGRERVEPLRPSRVDLARLVEEVRRDHEVVAATEGIRLRAWASPGAAACTDPVMVERVARNLVTNAIRHNRPGGRALLAARRPRRADGPGAGAVLEVWDTGRGIAAHRIAAAWEGLRGGAGVAAPRGIGLATVRRLAARLGARVECRSTPDRGTLFRVVIPAKPPSPSSARPEAPPAPPPQPLGRDGPRPIALAVEDEPGVLESIRDALDSFGMDVRTASGAAAGEALVAAVAAAGERPALVLTDWCLPDGTGGGVGAAARTLFGPKVTLVVLSGAAGPEAHAWAGAWGAVIVRKPASAATLRSIAALASAGGIGGAPESLGAAFGSG